MRFCSRNSCNNVLTTVTKQSELIYKCMVCLEEYPLRDEDTLIFDEYLQESNSIHKYRNYLQNAHADSIIELIHKKCPATKCPETIMNVVKIAQNGQALHVCPTCHHQFE